MSQSNYRKIPRYSLLARSDILSRGDRERVWKKCNWTLTVMALGRVQNKVGLPAAAGACGLKKMWTVMLFLQTSALLPGKIIMQLKSV